MSTISISVIFAFYKCAPDLQSPASVALNNFGIAIYGTYLLCPIISWYVASTFNLLEQFLEIQKIKYVRTAVCIPLTIGTALLAYKYLEPPLMALGKRLTESKEYINVKSGSVRNA